MTSTQILTFSAQIVSALFALLILILGWMGNKVYSKLESMTNIFDDLRKELHEIDSRVTRLEERSRFDHDQGIPK